MVKDLTLSQFLGKLDQNQAESFNEELERRFMDDVFLFIANINANQESYTHFIVFDSFPFNIRNVSVDVVYRRQLDGKITRSIHGIRTYESEETMDLYQSIMEYANVDNPNTVLMN